MEQSKNMLQHNLLIDISLFMSCTSIPNAINNYHFREFIKGFQHSFKLPPIGTDIDEILDKELSDTIDKTKVLLQSIPRFTLMINAIELNIDESIVLCISIGFVVCNQFQVILLSAQQFDIQDTAFLFNIRTSFMMTLQKYNLNFEKIIRTCIGGFEELGIDSNEILVPYHFISSIPYQLSKVINEVLAKSDIFKHTNFHVKQMINSFCLNEKELDLFEEICGIILNFEELAHENQVHLLLKYRDQFLKICSQYSDVYLISSSEWNFLMEIEQLKFNLLQQFKAFNDGGYVNISSFVPQLHKCLAFLRTDLPSLNEIPKMLILQIEQQFGHILDFNNTNFDPIYIQSTFLNPNFCGKLNEEQIMKAKESLEDLIYNQVSSQRIKLDNINDKFKLNGENMSTVREYSSLLVQCYYEYVKKGHLKTENLNVFEFWLSNYKTYGELAQLALEFLSIPITSTLPYDSVVNCEDSYGESFGDDYSIKDPFDFIKMTQNVENLERNAIIRLNRHLSNLGRKPKVEQVDSCSEIEEEKPIIVENVKRSLSQAPKIHRLSPNLGRPRKRIIPLKKYSKAKFGEFTSPLIMVYHVNHENFNCKRIFNLFMGYGDVLKIKFLYDKKSTSMVEMESIVEARTVFKYLNDFNAFGCQIRIRNSTIATSIHSRGEKFEMLCGGSSLMEFYDSDFSKLTTKRDPTYPSRKIHFSNLPLNFTDDEIANIFSKKQRNGPMPKSIIRDEPQNSDFLSGVMVFDNSEQATEAIMLYNFLRISDRHILNLWFKRMSSK